jgi:hypothetical protein
MKNRFFGVSIAREGATPVAEERTQAHGTKGPEVDDSSEGLIRRQRPPNDRNHDWPSH